MWGGVSGLDALGVTLTPKESRSGESLKASRRRRRSGRAPLCSRSGTLWRDVPPLSVSVPWSGPGKVTSPVVHSSPPVSPPLVSPLVTDPSHYLFTHGDDTRTRLHVHTCIHTHDVRVHTSYTRSHIHPHTFTHSFVSTHVYTFTRDISVFAYTQSHVHDEHVQTPTHTFTYAHTDTDIRLPTYVHTSTQCVHVPT